MKNLIIDVDDVLLDWQGAFAKWITDKTDRVLDPAGPSSWDLCAWAGPNAFNLIELFNASPAFKEIPFLPGALAFFDRFEKLALPYEINILSSCGDDHLVIHRRLANLRIIDGLISGYQFLPLGASKQWHLAQCPVGSVLVEDNLKHAQDAVDLGMTAFVFRRNHNHAQEKETPEHDRLIWIDTWQPVLDYLSRNAGESR